MTDQPNKIGDQIESAFRMLNHARSEFRADRGEDAVVFLRAARSRIDAAMQSLDASATVIALPRGKEPNHAR